MDSVTRQNLPKELTNYDFLKMAAVILMIIDHVGGFLFPEITWMRLLGRFCVPIWFFLIGYARSRDLSWPLWAGAGILIAFDFVVGPYIVPVNILVTIILIRLVLPSFMKLMLWHWVPFFLISALLFFLAVPSFQLLDYGTQGLLLAMFGYFVRRQDDIGWKNESVIGFMLFCFAGFVGLQWMVFSFSIMQVVALFWGSLCVFLLLYHFKPETYPLLSEKLPAPVRTVIKIFGRRTMEIYVLHLIIIQAYASWLYPDRYPFLEWEWFMPVQFY